MVLHVRQRSHDVQPTPAITSDTSTPQTGHIWRSHLSRCATHPVKTPERSSCRASAGSCTAQAGRGVARQPSLVKQRVCVGCCIPAVGQQVALPSAAAAKWLLQRNALAAGGQRSPHLHQLMLVPSAGKCRAAQ